MYNTNSFTMLVSDVQVSTLSIDSLITDKSIFFQLAYIYV